MNTLIGLMDRISFFMLNQRWASAGYLPDGLALKLIKDGKLRVQFYGYLLDSKPSDGWPEYLNFEQRSSGFREPDWLTVRPEWAYRFLSGRQFALPEHTEFGYLATSLLDPSTLPTPTEGCRFYLFTEKQHLYDGKNFGITTSDILKIEKTFTAAEEALNASKILSAREQKAVIPELRGNNFEVLVNTLEAALIVLTEAVSANDAHDLMHQSGSNKGRPNYSAIADSIIEARERFHTLKEIGSDGTVRPGATRESIAEKLSRAYKQDLSGKLKERTP